MSCVIVMPGSCEFDLRVLQSVAGEFGLVVRMTDLAREFFEGRSCRDVAAVLFYRDALGPDCSWTEAIRQLRIALPGTRVVPCLGFSESTEWHELSDAGAFHALWLPLKENEVRQSFGFLTANLLRQAV